VIVLLTVTACVLVLALYPSAWRQSDTVRGFFASILATVASLFLFYYVDPRTKRPDQSAELRDAGFKSVSTNRSFGPDYWIDLLSALPTSEDDAIFVGKRLTDWREAPTYSVPLRAALIERTKRARECAATGKYRTTIIVEDSDAYSRWRRFLDPIINGDANARIALVKAPVNSINYAITICGKRMTVVHYVAGRTTPDNPTLDVLFGSSVWNLYISDIADTKDWLLSLNHT
jgi:hypothetical protein